jgi:tetratricopeptide (TPR) repeat protein
MEGIFNVPVDPAIPPRLLRPGTPQDAQDAVRSDNTALFDQADAFLAAYLKDHPGDVKNLTWHAQLFLAWADSAQLTQRTLAGSVKRLEAKSAELEGRLADTSLAAEQREALGESLKDANHLAQVTGRVLTKLAVVAEQKKAVGREKALALLASHPDTYEGFRLAADLHRLEEDWPRYQEAVAKLERLNPSSNGLLFLQGVVAFQRDKDYVAAEKHLAHAVTKDPQFTKARYYLALTYVNLHRPQEARQALEETLRTSPGHPFANAVRALVVRMAR